jgi:GntR family transcriptional regulator
VPELQYREIAAELRRRIMTGQLQPGMRLPSVLDLRAEFAASRRDIEDAIGLLKLQKLAERPPGKGYRVARRARQIVTTLSQDPESGRAGGDATGAYDEYMERLAEQASANPDDDQPIKPRRSHLAVEATAAPGYVAARLRLAPGDQVVQRYQEFWADQMPWAIQSTYYPMALVRRGAQDLLMAKDFKAGELRYIAESTGLERCGYRVRILARTPTADEAKFFILPEDGTSQVFSLIRTGYESRPDHRPYPFRVNFTVFAGDRHQFVINSGEFPDEPASPARDH